MMAILNKATSLLLALLAVVAVTAVAADTEQMVLQVADASSMMTTRMPLPEVKMLAHGGPGCPATAALPLSIVDVDESDPEDNDDDDNDDIDFELRIGTNASRLMARWGDAAYPISDARRFCQMQINVRSSVPSKRHILVRALEMRGTGSGGSVSFEVWTTAAGRSSERVSVTRAVSGGSDDRWSFVAPLKADATACVEDEDDVQVNVKVTVMGKFNSKERGSIAVGSFPDDGDDDRHDEDLAGIVLHLDSRESC